MPHLQLQLPGNNVEAGHVLRDAVLDLEPRVHLRSGSQHKETKSRLFCNIVALEYS